MGAGPGGAVTDKPTPSTCPHDIPGKAVAAGLRRARPGEQPTHVSECVRCGTKVHTIYDPATVRQEPP